MESNTTQPGPKLDDHPQDNLLETGHTIAGEPPQAELPVALSTPEAAPTGVAEGPAVGEVRQDLEIAQEAVAALEPTESEAASDDVAADAEVALVAEDEGEAVDAVEPIETAAEAAAAEAEAAAEAAEDEGEAVDAVEPIETAAEAEATAEAAEPSRIKRGEIVRGTVLETSPTEVLVDLGEDLIGVIASRELERMDHAALELLKVGNLIDAYVVRVRGTDGRPVLSLARAEEEGNWQLAEEHYRNKQVYFSKVAGYNKGGLIVRFGKVRGFVPASQISRERQQRVAGENPEERWGSMVGDDIAVKVVEIDRARNRLILSERAAAREWRERQKSHLLEGLAVGDRRTGRVISLADFGAFVDLGGADGLVHLTEMSWQHITHPRDVLEVGQEIEVEVISIDPARKRIGLSMKRLGNDPWMAVVQQYAIGQLVQATVTKLTKFGAFARLVDAPDIEGLIHISELADYRVSHPKEVVLAGDVLTLRIVKIDAERRRLGLSLRQVDSARYIDQDWGFVASDEPSDEPPSE